MTETVANRGMGIVCALWSLGGSALHPILWLDLMELFYCGGAGRGGGCSTDSRKLRKCRA